LAPPSSLTGAALLLDPPVVLDQLRELEQRLAIPRAGWPAHRRRVDDREGDEQLLILAVQALPPAC